jgi:hypothetical protein
MSDHTFAPGPTPDTVRAADGRVLTVPENWVLLPPGDAALTRRVKEAGEHWVVQEKKGRKVFSRGVWAPATTIERIRAELHAERATEGHAKRKAADAALLKTRAAAEQRVRSLGSELGLTPLARKRAHVETARPAPPDPLAEFRS